MAITDLLDTEIRDSLNDLVVSWWRLDILVVTDTIVSFGPEHNPNNLNESFFGMSHLIQVLDGIASVTRAHRTTDPLGAPGVLPNFRFDAHDLSRYDQIWLLGYDGGGNALSDAEKLAMARFMNAGGGVFATGDHADLGSALASGLPRVRSMRHWNAPPPALGAGRVDTTVPDQNGTVVFENQSDDIPQKLELRWYEWSHHRWTREVYPHPLMCSSSGPIEFFPDHMHEGEVTVPASLNDVVTLPGLTFDEYPLGSDGQRVSPEVVAWGLSGGYADPEVMHGVHVGDPVPSFRRWSGTVGAYDGHRAGVGRVVVDATWHHFFDINLIGDNAANRPSFTDPRKALWSKGFTGSPQGQATLAKIDQYYRNIAHWLSPGVGVFNRWAGLTVALATSRHLVEVIDPKADPHALGAYAWEVAIRRWPPCLVMRFALDVVLAELPPLFRVPCDPWDVGTPRREPQPGPDDGPPTPPIPPSWLVHAALGGSLLALAQVSSAEQLEGERGARLLAQAAVDSVRRSLRNELEAVQSDAQQLERAREILG
ncbi:MAG: hypothetical protein QOJ62_2783 [Actinomycetota bacterium]|nr:hypothetical protein [Actinomycetota bacterium]